MNSPLSPPETKNLPKRHRVFQAPPPILPLTSHPKCTDSLKWHQKGMFKQQGQNTGGPLFVAKRTPLEVKGRVLKV